MPYIRLVKITLEVTKNKVSKSNLIGCYSNKNDFIAQTMHSAILMFALSLPKE